MKPNTKIQELIKSPNIIPEDEHYNVTNYELEQIVIRTINECIRINNESDLTYANKLHLESLYIKNFGDDDKTEEDRMRLWLISFIKDRTDMTTSVQKTTVYCYYKETAHKGFMRDNPKAHIIDIVEMNLGAIYE